MNEIVNAIMPHQGQVKGTSIIIFVVWFLVACGSDKPATHQSKAGSNASAPANVVGLWKQVTDANGASVPTYVRKTLRISVNDVMFGLECNLAGSRYSKRSTHTLKFVGNRLQLEDNIQLDYEISIPGCSWPLLSQSVEIKPLGDTLSLHQPSGTLIGTFERD